MSIVLGIPTGHVCTPRGTGSKTFGNWQLSVTLNGLATLYKSLSVWGDALML